MIALIAAVAKNNCIGKQGALPWYLPADLKHFKKLTLGHVVIMGRKTWDSIPEKFKPLPKRANVVITRQANFKTPSGVEIYHTIPEALAARPGEDIFIIGGAEIYNQTIALADTLYITEVHKPVDGDAFFPEFNKVEWQETERENHEEISFVTYVHNGRRH